MAKVLHLSRNTVAKHMRLLEEHGLIITEWTQIQMKNGIRKNGNLRCTIVPMHDALERCCQRQMTELERQQVQQKLSVQSTETICPPCEPLCGLFRSGAASCPEERDQTTFGRLPRLCGGRKKRQGKILKPGRELRFSEYKNMPPAEPGAYPVWERRSLTSDRAPCRPRPFRQRCRRASWR